MNIGTRFSARARLMAAHSVITLLGIFAFAVTTLAQPAIYFAPVEGLTGNTLKVQLEQIIDGHTRIPYTSSSTDIWDAHKDLYEDPNNSDNLILFYSQASWDKSAQDPGSGSEEYWNREHLWPRSFGIGSSGDDYSDLFHLVPANKAVNNDRSNNYFDVADPNDPDYEAVAHPIAPLCKEISGVSWEPADGQKGWTARAMFYMTTRYNYLSLVDTPPDPEPFTDGTFMAQKSVLLDWNRRFLPAAKELEINQRIYDDYQHNRNPYIDYPEFADAVFVTGPSWGGWRLEHFSLEELLDPSISGDYADPDFDGLINLVEMARYSDPRAAGDKAIEGSISTSQLVITFIRASDMANLNLSMVLEVSTDLQSWGPADLSGAAINTLNPEQEEVALTRSVSPGTTEFYRISVTRP